MEAAAYYHPVSTNDLEKLILDAYGNQFFSQTGASSQMGVDVAPNKDTAVFYLQGDDVKIANYGSSLDEATMPYLYEGYKAVGGNYKAGGSLLPMKPVATTGFVISPQIIIRINTVVSISETVDSITTGDSGRFQPLEQVGDAFLDKWGGFACGSQDYVSGTGQLIEQRINQALHSLFTSQHSLDKTKVAAALMSNGAIGNSIFTIDQFTRSGDSLSEAVRYKKGADPVLAAVDTIEFLLKLQQKASASSFNMMIHIRRRPGVLATPSPTLMDSYMLDVLL